SDASPPPSAQPTPPRAVRDDEGGDMDFSPIAPPDASKFVVSGYPESVDSDDEGATAYDLMVAGQAYPLDDPEIDLYHRHAADHCRALTNAPADGPERLALIYTLFDVSGEDIRVEPPLAVAFGRHITTGERVQIGPGCRLLDFAPIVIGDQTVLGCEVLIQTQMLPMNPAQRAERMAKAAPVEIGEDCWIGDRVTIYPGVRIGDGTTVAAGSVVTSNLPTGVLAAGNPCKVVRKL
ncbi:MAG: DapH/DapD/GlmU-related protein, partial [Bacteroidota bacterium]